MDLELVYSASKAKLVVSGIMELLERSSWTYLDCERANRT